MCGGLAGRQASAVVAPGCAQAAPLPPTPTHQPSPERLCTACPPPPPAPAHLDGRHQLVGQQAPQHKQPLKHVQLVAEATGEHLEGQRGGTEAEVRGANAEVKGSGSGV